MDKLALAAIGDNCVDKFLSRGIARIGGNALNVAVHFARAGAASSYYGAVGEDADGHWTRDVLVENGVNVANLKFRPEITAYTNIRHTADGDRIFEFEEFGACRPYRPTAAEIGRLAKLNHVHIGWFQGTDALSEALREAPVTRSIDTAVNRQGGPMDLAFGSVGKAPEEARSECDKLLAQGHRLVVVTRGAAGSLASDGRETWHAEAEKAVVVDTTGAGDTFAAYFIASWKQDGNIPRALSVASKEAAKSCTYFGGFPQTERPLAVS